MNQNKINRVKFFSMNDVSCGFELSKAESILLNFDRAQTFGINDIIELFQIKLYIDSGLFLDRWTDIERTKFKEVVKVFWNVICEFWSSIDENNFEILFQEVGKGSQDSFWKLIGLFETYKKINESIFIKILNHKHTWVQKIFHHKKLVNFYGHVLRQYLLDNFKAAELLLSQFEEKHDREFSELHFPNCLSEVDKENIILNYLAWGDANLNYVRLIVNSKEIKISPKTRLKATKVERIKNDEILENGHVWNWSFQVSLSKIQEVPILITWGNNIQSISYSTKWLDQFDNSLSLFQLFTNLFGFTDESGLIQLVSKNSEMDMMEKIPMTSKNSYSKGLEFTRKSNLSHIQIIIFLNYLKGKNKSIEFILSEIIGGLINDFYSLKHLKINFPSENTSNLEKVRMIAPEFESLLKQFQLYTEDGNIDHELLRIGASPKKIGEIKSLVKKKYVYGTENEKLQILQNAFFSDQSILRYVEPYMDKYHDLYSLLSNENLRLTDFENYQLPAINKFLKDEYLAENSDGFVKINKVIELSIIENLYKNEVVSYWHLPVVIQEVVDQMYNDGLIYLGETLFTEPEQKFFNYYLNKSEFTNGLDLRNRYLHGTNSDSDEEHQNSYLIYLKLFVLALLKITDDLMINKFLTPSNLSKDFS